MRAAGPAAAPDLLLVLDGGIEPELERRGVVLRPTPGAPPASVREPAAVRGIMLDAARAGTDVLTAATGGLERRALARIGESRRAREWVVEAVRLARDAASAAEDAGLPDPTLPDGSSRRLRLAGLVTPLEGRQPELAPDRDVALEEHRVHVGLLADAGVDVVRIEGMTTIRESDAATEAASETGLETWCGVRLDESGQALESGERLQAWLEAVVRWRPAALLVQSPRAEATQEAIAAILAAGGSVPGAVLDGPLDEERVGDLHRGGMRLVAPGSDGSPERIASLRGVARTAADALATRREEEHAALVAWIGEGARRAVSGRAAWLGDAAPERLPDGFAWDRIALADVGVMPVERYRLAVLPSREPGAIALSRVVAALDRGGWLLVADEAAGDVLRVDDRVEALQPLDRAAASAAARSRGGWVARRRP